jgi:hypothetical protein
VPVSRSQSVQPRGSKGLKNMEIKKQKKVPDNERKLSVHEIFQKFERTGNFDKPDLSIPLTPIEKVLELKKFVEDQKKKKEKQSNMNFFQILRMNEETLKTDRHFQ